MNDRCSLWGKLLSPMIRLRMNVTNVYSHYSLRDYEYSDGS